MPQAFNPGDAVTVLWSDARNTGGNTNSIEGTIDSWDAVRNVWIVNTQMGFAAIFTDDKVKPA